MGNNTSIVDLPHEQDSDTYLRNMSGGINYQVAPARQISANGRAFAKKTGGVVKRILQNISTAPIFFWIQPEAPKDADGNDDYSGDPTVSPPHGVITPDTGDKKGYGGQVDFSNYENAIWIGNGTGVFECLAVEAFTPEAHSGNDEPSQVN